MTFRVLGVDPGKMSGIVVLRCADDLSFVEIELSEEKGQYETSMRIKEYSGMGAVDVVMEDFIITMETVKKKSPANWSLELIGVGRFFAQLNGQKFVLQPPSMKPFCNNDLIRKLGLWVPGGAGHAKDAMRHAIIHLMLNKNWTPKQALEEGQ